MDASSWFITPFWFKCRFLQCRWIVTAVQIYCGCIISENKSAPAAHSERWPDANAAADCCRPAASCPNLNNLVFYFYFQQTDYKLYKLTVWGNGNFPPRWWDVWHEESDSNILKPGINVDSSYKMEDLKVNGLLVTPNIITDLWVATDLSKIETK